MKTFGTGSILFANHAGVDIQAKMFNPTPGEIMDLTVALDKTHLFDGKSGQSLRS